MDAALPSAKRARQTATAGASAASAAAADALRSADLARDSAVEAEVAMFKTLLRFRTVCGEGARGAYAECVAWLRAQCEELGLACQVQEFVAGKPVLVATLRGSEPGLPSLLLNSHFDVVPAMEEHWSVDPWAAVEHADGKIYGRGAQDMKSVCAQYILALKRLKAQHRLSFRRTVHLSFVPDEEVGGADGMAAWLASRSFSELGRVGLALDEGLANPADAYTVFYGERAPLWVYVTAAGPTGHGSRFIADTAVQKLLCVAGKAASFRRAEQAKLGYGQGQASVTSVAKAACASTRRATSATPAAGAAAGGQRGAPASSSTAASPGEASSGCTHCQAKKLGDVTTLNLTMLSAGVSADGGHTYSLNVIPTKAIAGFDIRVPPTVTLSSIEGMLDTWCAAEGLSWAYAPKMPRAQHFVTETGDKNPWWRVFAGALSGARRLEREIFPAARSAPRTRIASRVSRRRSRSFGTILVLPLRFDLPRVAPGDGLAPAARQGRGVFRLFAHAQLAHPAARARRVPAPRRLSRRHPSLH